MKAEDFFAGEAERLQLLHTYQADLSTYTKIKNKIAGDAAKEDWQRQQRGRRLFLLAVTLIVVLSSVFIVFSEEWASLAAVWIIWTATAIGFVILSTLSYRSSYAVLLRNIAFFERFEKIAADKPSPTEFLARWAA